MIRTLAQRTPKGIANSAEGGSSAALLRAIEPVGVEEFLTGYWEREPLLVQRDDPGRFDDLLSAADAEELICSGGLRYPSFRLVKEQAKLELADYTAELPWRPAPFSGMADVPQVLAELEAGATVVLQALHHSWRPLRRYCRQLEAFLGHPVQANAYLTPRTAQGLSVHHDTHDVFVLQIAGSKRWLVYRPALELPHRGQHYRSELGEPGPALLEATLQPGATLYLPRGWLHEARASEGSSLHLTVGVNVYTWVDALRAAVERLKNELPARRSVPDSGEGGEQLLRLLARELDPQLVAARRRRTFVEGRRPILTDQLSQLDALEQLELDTPLERRDTVVFDLRVTGTQAVLAFEGKRILLPARVLDELAATAASQGPFTLDALPGELDGAGRLVLGRRLVREGFLVISRPPAGRGSPQSA